MLASFGELIELVQRLMNLEVVGCFLWKMKAFINGNFNVYQNTDTNNDFCFIKFLI